MPADRSESINDDATLPNETKRLPASDVSFGDVPTSGGGDDAGIDPLLDGSEIVDLAKRYAIEGPLGKGGMGTVVLATDPRLGRKVAIKQILSKAVRSKGAMERFRTEAKAIAAISHPNVVQIYEMGVANDGPFLVIEYIDGGSLLDRCKAGPMPMEEAVLLVCQVCDGLAKAHDLGITHRDIKPANILLTKDGIAKLTDFGLAKTASDRQLTGVGAVMGTPDFMPPEQQRDAALVDHRSDLWSLAATLYQAVSGRSPKVIRLHELPQALQPVVSKALEDEKVDRYQTARELRDSLKASLRVAAAASGVVASEGQCPACGVQNDPSRRFCRGCGGSLEAPCLSCDTPMPIGEEICGSCGGKQTPLTQARRAVMAAEQAKAEGLLGDFLFDEAAQIAVQLRDEPHSRLSHLKDWGEEFLSEIEKSRQHQVRQTLETLVEASKHEEVHDYLSAIFALDSVPAAMRSTVLPGARETVSNALARVKKAQDEVRRLESLVKERLAAKSLDGLVVEVERLLLLQPDRSDVAKLRAQLLERQDGRDCAVASARGFLEAHDYEGALSVLSALPASYSTRQITNLQNQAATLVTHVRGLMAQIRAAAAEKQFDGLLTTVDAYLRLKPADAEVLKLRQSLVARDEKIAAELAEQLKQAKALEKACRFDEAAKMLATLPENQKTDGIRENVKRYGILATKRAKALQALMEASAGRYGEAIQATGGYAWQLISLGLVDAEFTETRGNILSWQAKEARQRELYRTSSMAAGYVVAALIVVSCGLWVRSSLRAASVANSLRESRWDDALAVDPENVTALVARALGKLLASPPDIDGAFADIGRAEKLPDSSKNVEAARGKAHAARAIDHVRHDRLAEASQDLAEAVRRNTDTYSSLAAARGAVAAAWLLRAKKAVAKRDNVLVENACYFAEKAGAPADVVAAILTAVEAGRWDEAAEAVAPYARDLKQRQSVAFTNSIGVSLKLLTAGSFTMGDAASGPDEKPHRVTLRKPFYVGVHEVTNAQWKQVMGSVPSYWQQADHPVEQVRWVDAVEFCRKLSALPAERKAGRVYRLPTEAEWEYACRAGTKATYSFGDDENLLSDYGWFDENSGRQTHPVGQKKPNAWGLYDMHGNVREWCSDWSGDYPVGEVTNPQGTSSGWFRVYRGGSCSDAASHCRSTYRYWYYPFFRRSLLGFRLALSPSGVQPVPPEAGTDQRIKNSTPSEDSTPAAVIASGSMPVSTATAVNLPETIGSTIGINLKLIPAGTFTMGESGGEPKYKPHRVTLTKPFYMGVHEVTRKQWKQVMGSVPGNWEQASRPVEQMSWEEAVEFCRKLSSLPEERKAGRVYRLPTEAEWEYACRAGSTTSYLFGEDEKLLGDYGWFDGNSSNQTYPVGQKKPNVWGLYDMHGNVWEWCSDWYGDYPDGESTDPQGPSSGSERVRRGGGWLSSARNCRSANRDWSIPSYRSYDFGFRLALSPSGADWPEAGTDQGIKISAPSEDSTPTAVIASGSKPISAAAASTRPETIASTVGIRLQLIPAGTFTMGDAAGGSHEKPHRVTLTQPFYMGVHEVTNAQWKQVMGSVPSTWMQADHPVEMVSWEDAVEFCRKLAELPEERKAGRVYRLPTEAEWEYASRAGTTTKYSFGEDEKLLGDYGWFDGNSGSLTHPVGQKTPNAWGMYDMHGNVLEWCSDWYGGYPDGEVINPQGPGSGSCRVFRGGSWYVTAGDCRSAIRFWDSPSLRSCGLGFRLALSPSGAETPEAGK